MQPANLGLHVVRYWQGVTMFVKKAQLMGGVSRRDAESEGELLVPRVLTSRVFSALRSSETTPHFFSA